MSQHLWIYSMFLETKAKIEKGKTLCKRRLRKMRPSHAGVSVPIELRLKAALGDIEMEYYSKPEAGCREDKHKDVFKVIVTKKASLKISIRYQICSALGESFIKCDCPDK